VMLKLASMERAYLFHDSRNVGSREKFVLLAHARIIAIVEIVRHIRQEDCGVLTALWWQVSGYG
jgi:hypothetical protein